MGFQIAGIAILLLFYGCYIAKMTAQGRRGIRTDQMGRGKSGSAKRIESALRTVTYGTVLTEAVSIALDTGSLPLPVRTVGMITSCIGTAVFILSVLTMKDSWRAGVPGRGETELVTRGIYQLSRNPAFLGFDLVYIGLAVTFFNWALLAVSMVAAAALHLQIVKVEEPFLAESFGEEYRRYRETVCRYLGRKRR